MALTRGQHTLLLTVHVTATVAVLGADLALLALGIAGLRGADPRSIYPAAHLLGQWLAAPLAVASLASGVLLAVTTTFKPFRYRWVTVKGAITLILTGLLLTALVPGLGRAADAATGATPQPVTHVQQLLYTLAPAGAALLLTVNVALGMYKPHLRQRAVHPAGHRGDNARPPLNRG
jgi:hypothetical protein